MIRRQEVLCADDMNEASIRETIGSWDRLQAAAEVGMPDPLCIVLRDELSVLPAEVRLEHANGAEPAPPAEPAAPAEAEPRPRTRRAAKPAATATAPPRKRVVTRKPAPEPDRRPAEALSFVTCPDCARTFGNQHALDVHRGKAHRPPPPATSDGILRCPDCDATFSTMRRYEEHRRRIHPDAAERARQRREAGVA